MVWCVLVMDRSGWFLFFFFQAEDGIRDVAVTGVQTCALPISPPSASSSMTQDECRRRRAAGLAGCGANALAGVRQSARQHHRSLTASGPAPRWTPVLPQVDADNLRLGGPHPTRNAGIRRGGCVVTPTHRDYRRLLNAVFSVSGDCIAPISLRQSSNGNSDVAGV